MNLAIEQLPEEELFHPDYKQPVGHLYLIKDYDNVVAERNEKEAYDRLACIFDTRVEEARTHFPSFMEYCFCDEKTGIPFEQQWFHDEWSVAMDGHDRVLIIAPRDHGKTTQIVGRVIWELGRNPDLRIKIACASDGRAKERLFEIVQNIIYNKRVQEVFPRLRPAKTGEWSKHKIVVERKARHRDASVEAIGITATATGGRCDLLIADDVVDRRNALSFPALREQIKQAWKSDWTNLLEPDSRVWYICTLWHKDDLSHQLMQNPAYKTYFYAVPETFGSLWPGKWGTQQLLKRYREIGSVEFNRGFRNVAVDLENATVKPEWIKYVDLREDPEFVERFEHLIFFSAYDTAGTPSKKKAQDFAAEVVAAVDPDRGRIYIISAWHYRKTVKGQGEQVIAGVRKYKPFRAIVEKASQSAVDEWVMELDPLGAGAVMETMTPTQQSKTEKLMGVTPLMEMGRVIFDASLDPDGETWNPAKGSVVDELIDFPFAKHDDLVDAFVMCLHAIRRYFLDDGANGGEMEIDISFGNNTEKGYVL